MRKLIQGSFAVVISAVMLFGLVGCASPATSDAPVKGDPTSGKPAVEPSAINEGKPIDEIADPVDPTRQALMAAAHEYLDIPAEEKFIGWQCLVQGTTAVLDIQQAVGDRRELVALVDGETGWTGAYSAKYLDATSAALVDKVPQITAALADAVVFMVPIDMDPGYAAMAKNARADLGVPEIYAPTRMPEGFRLTNTESGFEYSDGVSTIIVNPVIHGDWGEGELPAKDITGLWLGELPATMDRDFKSEHWMGVAGKSGPFLLAIQPFDHPEFGSDSYEIWIGSYGATPGMVAAVGESMVKVQP